MREQDVIIKFFIRFRKIDLRKESFQVFNRKKSIGKQCFAKIPIENKEYVTADQKLRRKRLVATVIAQEVTFIFFPIFPNGLLFIVQRFL